MTYMMLWFENSWSSWIIRRREFLKIFVVFITAKINIYTTTISVLHKDEWSLAECDHILSITSENESAHFECRNLILRDAFRRVQKHIRMLAIFLANLKSWQLSNCLDCKGFSQKKAELFRVKMGCNTFYPSLHKRTLLPSFWAITYDEFWTDIGCSLMSFKYLSE